jgi:LPS O-antigen subunit length determinant protein (WzzB/FepE family)
MTSPKKAAVVILAFLGIFILGFASLLGYELWNTVVGVFGRTVNAIGR